MANKLLAKVFQSSSFYLFLKEYETISAQFEATLETNLQLNEENRSAESIKIGVNCDLTEESYSIDYFYEYIKPFVIKKSKVSKLGVLFRFL